MKYNDSIDKMLNDIRQLANELDQVEINVNTTTLNRNVGATYPFQTTSIIKHKIYDEFTALSLKGELDNLANKICEILQKKRHNQSSSEFEYSKLEQDAKQILLHTYRTVLDPTSTNCNALNKKATEVSGQRNILAKVGILLAAIVGLTCFIYPGIVFLIYLATSDLWQRNSQRGMAKLAYDMHNAIMNTGVPKNMSELNIVKPEVQSENPAEAQQQLAMAVPLTDPVVTEGPRSTYNPTLFAPQNIGYPSAPPAAYPQVYPQY